MKHESFAPDFKPISSFSGRLLVMNQAHRFQLEMDWKSSEYGGMLRLTHGLSGRVVDVEWQGESMVWRDNKVSPSWENLTEQDLLAMGVMLPPWTLARVFLGDLPNSMRTKNQRLWKGTWGHLHLSIRWAREQGRVELLDLKHGRRVVVVFDD